MYITLVKWQSSQFLVFFHLHTFFSWHVKCLVKSQVKFSEWSNGAWVLQAPFEFVRTLLRMRWRAGTWYPWANHLDFPILPHWIDRKLSVGIRNYFWTQCNEHTLVLLSLHHFRWALMGKFAISGKLVISVTQPTIHHQPAIS